MIATMKIYISESILSELEFRVSLAHDMRYDQYIVFDGARYKHVRIHEDTGLLIYP